MKNYKIGWIGQGWIGKHYADDFESRGYDVVRYDISPKYRKNLKKIKTCDIVFVAVPTPSTPEGFDDSILINAISKTKAGQIVVIKSTIVVGTTDKIQKLFKDRVILHSPEFLTEKTAKYDASNPNRNVIGYPRGKKKYCKAVLNVLPWAKNEYIIPAKEAELLKYAGNIWFYMKVLTINMIYDIARGNKIDYDIVKEAMKGDPRIGDTHLEVLHQGGRGAGGHCFIKDFEAFKEMYKNVEGFEEAENLLNRASDYNKKLLKSTKKDIKLAKGVYGDLR
jgi:UDPglucose 6-dehydrogenase